MDTAVRRALGSLLLEGSHGLVMLVRKTLDEAHTPKEIKESLKSVLHKARSFDAKYRRSA